MFRSVALAFCCLLVPTSAWSLSVAGFGDSLTAGGDYLAYLPAEWEKADLGVPGETSIRGKGRFLNLLPGLEADILVVLEGTNDVRRATYSPEATVGNLAEIVDAALETGLRVVLVAPPVITPHTSKHSDDEARIYNAYLSELSGALENQARARGIPFVDLFGLFSELEDPETYFWDGVHPNSAGRALMAQPIETAVRLAPVPEPASALLLATGLVAMAWASRARSAGGSRPPR